MLTRSPNTWDAIIATVNRHPQSPRLNQPIAARARATESSRNAIPTALPYGASSLYARGFRVHMRSSLVPCHTREVPARKAVAAPKTRKIPITLIPRGDPTGGELEEG